MFLKKAAIILVILVALCGCNTVKSSDHAVEQNNYKTEIENSWRYIQEMNWNDRVSSGIEAASVKKVVVDENYELLDNSYYGDEVLEVSFEDNQDSVIGAPSILVSSSGDVIGHSIGE